MTKCVWCKSWSRCIACILSSSVKSGKNNRISDNFSFISIMSLCDCRWYSFYVMTIFSMATCNLSNPWINVAFETHNNLSCGTLKHVFLISELGIYFVFFCISMCYVRLYETVQARFINKCWRRGFFLFGFFNFINLYGRFKKKYMLHQIIITIIINLLYTVMYLYKSFKLALRINPMSMT